MAHTILVVDDAANTRDILLFLLRNKGFQVLQAADGEEALAKATGPVRPSLILLDAMMPKLSGFEVCSRLRGDDRWKDIPIIMLSAAAGDVDETVRRWNKNLQPDLVLPKPFKIQDLLEHIATLLQAGADTAARPRPS